MPSVDVIVPCYRYGKYLQECVSSVLAAKTCDVRVLILDDASPDDTPDVATRLQRDDPRVEYRRHAQNCGHIATYNEGIAWARSDYLMLLSADDFVTPGALDRAVAVLRDNPTVGMVYGQHLELRNDDAEPTLPAGASAGPDDGTCQIYDTRDFFELNRRIPQVATATVVVRTDLQKRIGGYNPELPHAGDFEMWLRFALHARVARVNAAQGVWRLHGQNMSESYFSNMMRDLEQRKRSLEVLFALPAAAAIADMRRAMNLGLATSALCCANEPFVKGNVAQAQEMMAFARRVSPEIARTLAWHIQTAKIRLGARTWLKVRALVVERLGLKLDMVLK
ncbi:hypothetical protein OPKNFCMD_5887 [Methylobacterium crusticola]|uniref:Glycosyltransferase 2-like domain-containing protein n=1 Tax=Methylobacterium crusticola TaxID=1697972 RepID=A0ABQ4R5Z8_9HYPH|nr:glycosyltransferase family 2 protein [Methylobacterium crusticola]GJD53116.1 hypothetical protein OPKNFCMD_5887 [Methylobacterium crusticola]